MVPWKQVPLVRHRVRRQQLCKKRSDGANQRWNPYHHHVHKMLCVLQVRIVPAFFEWDITSSEGPIMHPLPAPLKLTHPSRAGWVQPTSPVHENIDFLYEKDLIIPLPPALPQLRHALFCALYQEHEAFMNLLLLIMQRSLPGLRLCSWHVPAAAAATNCCEPAAAGLPRPWRSCKIAMHAAAGIMEAAEAAAAAAAAAKMPPLCCTLAAPAWQRSGATASPGGPRYPPHRRRCMTVPSVQREKTDSAT